MPVFARRTRQLLFAVIATLAIAAQLVVALVPLAESRAERTLSAHVEQTGTRGHTSHNEATCASCQARSIHGTTARQLFELPDVTLAVSSYVMAAERLVSTPFHPQANPRAPPAVV
jgi:hypothetical protein